MLRYDDAFALAFSGAGFFGCTPENESLDVIRTVSRLPELNELMKIP